MRKVVICLAVLVLLTGSVANAQSATVDRAGKSLLGLYAAFSGSTDALDEGFLITSLSYGKFLSSSFVLEGMVAAAGQISCSGDFCSNFGDSLTLGAGARYFFSDKMVAPYARAFVSGNTKDFSNTLGAQLGLGILFQTSANAGIGVSADYLSPFNDFGNSGSLVIGASVQVLF